MDKNVKLIEDIKEIEKIQEKNGLPRYDFAKFMDKVGYVYSTTRDSTKVQFTVDNKIIHLVIHSSLLQTNMNNAVTISLPPEHKSLSSKAIKSDQIPKDNIFMKANSIKQCETKVDSLFKAIKNKEIDDITYLCKNNTHINDCDSKNQNAFHYAAYVGSVSKMETLKKFNVDVMALDCDGDSALHLATFGQKFEAVDYLVKHHPVLLKTLNKKKETPLLSASKKDNTNDINTYNNIFLKLLEHNSEIINNQDINGNTVLHYVAMQNNLNLLKRILYIPKIKVFLFNSKGWSPIHVACNSGQQGTIKCLCEHLRKTNNLFGINEINLNKESGAHILIRKKLHKLAIYLIKIQPKQWSLDPAHPKYGSILHYAVNEANLELVKSIVESDPEIKFVKNDQNKTGIDLSLEMYAKGAVENYIQGRDISKYLSLSGSNVMLEKNKRILQRIKHWEDKFTFL